MMENFFEYFRKKAPSQMFEQVLHTTTWYYRHEH